MILLLILLNSFCYWVVFERGEDFLKTLQNIPFASWIFGELDADIKTSVIICWVILNVLIVAGWLVFGANSDGNYSLGEFLHTIYKTLKMML